MTGQEGPSKRTKREIKTVTWASAVVTVVVLGGLVLYGCGRFKELGHKMADKVAEGAKEVAADEFDWPEPSDLYILGCIDEADLCMVCDVRNGNALAILEGVVAPVALDNGDIMSCAELCNGGVGFSHMLIGCRELQNNPGFLVDK